MPFNHQRDTISKAAHDSDRKGAPLAEGEDFVVHGLVDGTVEVTIAKPDGSIVQHTGPADLVRARCERDADTRHRAAIVAALKARNP